MQFEWRNFERERVREREREAILRIRRECPSAFWRTAVDAAAGIRTSSVTSP